MKKDFIEKIKKILKKESIWECWKTEITSDLTGEKHLLSEYEDYGIYEKLYFTIKHNCMGSYTVNVVKYFYDKKHNSENYYIVKTYRIIEDLINGGVEKIKEI